MRTASQSPLSSLSRLRWFWSWRASSQSRANTFCSCSRSRNDPECFASLTHEAISWLRFRRPQRQFTPALADLGQLRALGPVSGHSAPAPDGCWSQSRASVSRDFTGEFILRWTTTINTVECSFSLILLFSLSSQSRKCYTGAI
jgi:hypothetical protein